MLYYFFVAVGDEQMHHTGTSALLTPVKQGWGIEMGLTLASSEKHERIQRGVGGWELLLFLLLLLAVVVMLVRNLSA